LNLFIGHHAGLVPVFREIVKNAAFANEEAQKRFNLQPRRLDKCVHKNGSECKLKNLHSLVREN